MKKSIIAAIVLAACLLLAPFGFGKLAEKRVNAGLDILIEQMPFLVITERNWQGGWFKSSQQVRVELSPAIAALVNPQAMQQAIDASLEQMVAEDAAAADATEPEAAGADPAAEAVADDATAEAEAAGAEAAGPAAVAAAIPGFTIRNDVVHGPVLGSAGFGLARVDTTFEIPAEIAAEIRKVFGPDPAVQVRSRVGFFRGGSTTLTSDGRTIKAEIGDNELTYETAQLVLGYGSNFDTYDADGGLPRMEIRAGQGANVLLTDMTFKAEGKRVLRELYDGDFALELGELKLANAGSEYTVADLHYTGDTRTTEGFTDIAARMGSGAVTAAELAAFGLDIQEIHYDMSFRHLHAETVEKLIVAMRDFYTRLPAGGDAQAMAAAMQTGFLEPLKAGLNELLQHDPVLGFDRVGLVTADGEGVMRGTVKLVGANTNDFTAMGAIGLLGKVELDLTIEVAQALADKVPNGAMVVGMAVSQGLAIREGDKLVCHVEFKGGELKINGKAQPIPPGVLPGVAPPPPALPGAGV